MNQYSFKHSSRKCPLKLSIYTFYVDLHGWGQLQHDSSDNGPLIERLAGEFRALVCTDYRWIAPKSSGLFQHTHDVMLGDRVISNQIDTFFTEIIHNGEHLYATPVG